MSLVLAIYCDDGLLLAGDGAVDVGKRSPIRFNRPKVQAIDGECVVAMTGMTQFSAGNDHVDFRREVGTALRDGDSRTCLAAFAAWCAQVVEQRCRPYCAPDRVQGVSLVLASRRGGTLELLYTSTTLLPNGAVRAEDVRALGPGEYAFLGWPTACLAARDWYLWDPRLRATWGSVLHASDVLDAFTTIVARLSGEGHPVGGPVTAAIVTADKIHHVKAQRCPGTG